MSEYFRLFYMKKMSEKHLFDRLFHVRCVPRSGACVEVLIDD